MLQSEYKKPLRMVIKEIQEKIIKIKLSKWLKKKLLRMITHFANDQISELKQKEKRIKLHRNEFLINSIQCLI